MSENKLGTLDQTPATDQVVAQESVDFLVAMKRRRDTASLPTNEPAPQPIHVPISLVRKKERGSETEKGKGLVGLLIRTKIVSNPKQANILLLGVFCNKAMTHDQNVLLIG